MNALWIYTIFALVFSIYAEETLEAKKQEKRGALPLGYGTSHGLGYGSNYLAGHNGYGYNALGHGFGLGHGLGLGYGLGNGYLHAPSYAPLNHAIPAPAITHPTYPSVPLPLAHRYNGYSHGLNVPLYNAPLRVGYAGLGEHAFGHGLGYGSINHAW